MNALFATPLFAVGLTLSAYFIAVWLYERSHRNAFLPPVLTGVLLVLLGLWLTNTPYAVYRTGASSIHFMLAPTVVMLAVLLFAHIDSIKQQWVRIFFAVTLGSATTVACAVLLCIWLIGDASISLSIYTKSVTTAVAVVVTEQLGGVPALASAFVIATGILGALIVPVCLRITNMDKADSMGLTLGICAHAVGTSRAMELGQKQAAYAAMGMTLTGALHALVLPLI